MKTLTTILCAALIWLAIPAAAGATIMVVAWRNDFYSGGLAIGVAAAVFVFRLAALRFGWRAPKPLARRRPS